MPIYVLLAIVSVLLIVVIYKRLKNSSKFDKFVKDITEEQELEEPKPGEVIKKINTAEQALLHKAEQQNKDAKRLKKDSEAIGTYLSDKGVIKPNKGKGTK